MLINLKFDFLPENKFYFSSCAFRARGTMPVLAGSPSASQQLKFGIGIFSKIGSDFIQQRQ